MTIRELVKESLGQMPRAALKKVVRHLQSGKPITLDGNVCTDGVM